MSDKLDSFTVQYIETALWSSTDCSSDLAGDPMDKNYTIEDMATETLTTMIDDCLKFQDANQGDLDNAEWSDARHGHNFWLTRNGHGCGFWDGDYPEGIEDRLTRASRNFGEFDLYIGDDQLIYGHCG